MAEVENVSQVTAAITPVAVTSSTETPLSADLAGSPKTANANSSGGSETGITVTQPEGTAGPNNDLGTSPTQEKSSNSHPHDSEYDTASDLDAGEEYDDDDDDIDESLSDEDDDDETETEDDDDDDDEGVEGDMTPQEKIDAEAKKKVDEDRSNPQYIPKRGTFYEHDDRTAELDGEVVEGERDEDTECQIVGNGVVVGTASGTKSATTPTISSASKTMKKWQPTSAVDRWSHDRFDPNEQAPKTRSDLVSAYGYDIRTEDAPPKARRRRRYGRGPSKYNRNWEDESAYLKTNNKERKPPKPSDFPALNEKSRKQRRSPTRRTREEKENHMERRHRVENKSEKSERQGPERNSYHEEHNDRRERGDAGHKPGKSKNNFNRQSGPATLGKQAPMEFKQKNRPNNQGSSGFHNQNTGSNLSSRLDAHRQQGSNSHPVQQNSKGSSNSQNFGQGKIQHQNAHSPQQHPNDNFNNRKKQDQGYSNSPQPQPQPINATQPSQGSPQQSQPAAPSSHNANRQTNAPLQLKTQIPTSNLSQRLQQVQNRNDPSHVGSVQMHSLATQNQQQQLMQQQQPGNVIMPNVPQPNPAVMNQSQEQRGPPKRYSSLRRSQHESQHMADHPQMQQLHMQQQQAPGPPPAMLIPAEQAMLQANLMQMYHQENMQAQMQALQVSQQPNVAKQPGYPTPPPQNPSAGPYPGAASNPAAYYVPAPDAYSAATAAQATQAASYAAQQGPPNYLAQQQSAASLAYANAPPTPQAAAATSAFAAAANVGVVPQGAPAQPPSGNYQNYNTVGGTTYFVPPHTQPSNRPVSLPQRRPTNAIPILPPSSEKNKPGQLQKSQDSKDDAKSVAGTASAPIGSAENIDHIIDNMFVQRPVFQPPAANATPSSTSLKTMNNESASSNDNSNISNSPAATNSTPSQDNNTHPANDKPTNEPTTSATTSSGTTATAATVAPATSAASSSSSIESTNNNPISTQE